jgi:hypothetical protein
MIAQYETYMVTDPLRDVDWRWRLANELAISRHSLDVGSFDDLTLRAARFRRGQSEAGPVSVPDEAVEAAWELSATYEDRRLKFEAKLLAGSSITEVARGLRESTDVVSAFAGLFFDVGSYLDHTDYIHCQVLHEPGQTVSPVERLRSCVHRLSYFGGPVVADAVLSHLPAMKAAIEGTYDFASGSLSLEKRLAVLTTAMTAPLTVRETLQLVEKCPKSDLRPDAAYEDVFAGELHDRLDEMLADASWETPVNEVCSGAEGQRQQVG